MQPAGLERLQWQEFKTLRRVFRADFAEIRDGDIGCNYNTSGGLSLNKSWDCESGTTVQCHDKDWTLYHH